MNKHISVAHARSKTEGVVCVGRVCGESVFYELGLVDGSSKISQLINIWINNIEYNYNKPSIKNNNIRASFSVNAIKSDFSDVLGSDYAQMTDNLRGYSLPWLKWLLLDGSMTIIDNYTVTMGYNKYSRTGNAVMTPSSGSWKIQSQFAGTLGDNWITRAIDNSTDSINNLLDKAFKI